MRIEDVFTPEEQLAINKKFVQFDPGNGRQKALIVPVEAIEGIDKIWTDYAERNGIAILPYWADRLKKD